MTRAAAADAIATLLASAMPDPLPDRRPFVLGLCGAQGSGKSTAAAVLARRSADDGRGVAILSLDDLYLDRDERLRLAARVHPLFATRGPPGTHDPAAGLALIAALGRGGTVALPRFDKATDRQGEPEPVTAPVDILIFEGWCVGARPQDAAALAAPVNWLEAEEDADGVWRGHANRALAGDYAALFARIDRLALLAAPGFGVVSGWRLEQERSLRARRGGGMGDAEVIRFVEHYRRLTEHILHEMPARADLVIPIGPDRMPLASATDAYAGSGSALRDRPE